MNIDGYNFSDEWEGGKYNREFLNIPTVDVKTTVFKSDKTADATIMLGDKAIKTEKFIGKTVSDAKDLAEEWSTNEISSIIKKMESTGVLDPEVQKALDDMQQEIDKITTTILPVMQNEIESQKAIILAHETEIGELNLAIDALTLRVTETEKDIENIVLPDLKPITDRIDKNESDILLINTSISTLNESIVNINTALVDDSVRITQSEEDTAAIQGRLVDYDNDLFNVSERVDSLDTNISTINRTLNNHETRIHNIEDGV